MQYRKSWMLAAIAGLSLMLFAGPALAFELSVDGSYTWEYEYIGQRGAQGFFGPYDVDRGNAHPAGAGFYPNLIGASLNGWIGDHGGGIVSGADGAWNTQYAQANLNMKVNNALTIRGVYYIGGWNDAWAAAPIPGVTGATPNVVASEYRNYTSAGVQRAFSPGYWNTLWMTAQLPWGTLAAGKRPSSWGCGLAWNGEENRSSEALGLTVPYGPFRIGVGFYPAREGDEGYYNRWPDKNNLRLFDITMPNVTYRSGPLDTGMQFVFVRRHRGAERELVQAGNAVPANGAVVAAGDHQKDFVRGRDREDFYGGVYAKYNNGRFFANTEIDWYNRIDREFGGFIGTTLIGRPSTYINHYRGMAELGVMAGPAKMTLFYSWSSGNDRRAGVVRGINQGMLADATTASMTTPNPRIQSATSSNTGVYRPYSFLAVYTYGLGSHINWDTYRGYVEAASCYAARLDYALAANLNIYGSFFRADRVGGGFGWGYLKPAPNDTTNYATNSNSAPMIGTPDGSVNGSYRGRDRPDGTNLERVAPEIPDCDLGWEVDTGFDWQLLEGLTVNATFAYWKPGKWFNYACIDKANPSWNADNGLNAGNGGANMWGINPNRKIDPMWGVEIKLVGSF